MNALRRHTFLISNDITVRDVVQMNNPDAKFNSCKVSVTMFYSSKMMNSDIWQFGIICQGMQNTFKLILDYG